jgi:tetratricopeptide (TPR) repeat protein
MKQVLFRCTFLVAFLLLSIGLFSQETQPTETREVVYQFKKTFIKGDSLFGWVDGGENQGIRLGLLGKCYNKYRGDSAKAGYSELGYGYIKVVLKDSSLCLISLYKKGSMEDSIRAEDLIALKVTIPRKDYHSIFFKLDLLNIEFKSNARIKILEFRDILTKDSREFEDSVFNVLVSDIKETWRNVQDKGKDYPQLLLPLQEGRYMGKSVMDVMRDVTVNDLKAFFWYLESFPLKYMGGNYKVNETFATWVLFNAPFSPYEVKEVMLPVLNNPEKFDLLLLKYRKSILLNNNCSTFADDAINLNNELKFHEAEQMSNFALRIANAVNDTAGKVSVYMAKAQIAQDQEKYPEAIRNCDSAVRFALQCGSHDLELQAYFKKGFCLYKLSQYAQAKKTLFMAEEKLALYKE